MDDSAIVDLYLTRDESAIDETGAKYGSRLRSLSYGIVGETQTAEECENDMYMEAWESIPPHEPRDYLYAFLARIIRHISLNRCRDRSRLKRSAVICELGEELEECIGAPSDAECRLDDIVLRDAINAYLASLDEEKRVIFVRRYFYTDTVAEISARLSLSESKVKTVLYRCRIKLREQLENEGWIL